MLRRRRESVGLSMFPRRQTSYVKRKLIEFAPEIWLALDLLAKDTGRSVQDFAEEAFADLLKKHGIPVDLKDALRKSASLPKTAAPKNARSSPSRKPKS